MRALLILSFLGCSSLSEAAAQWSVGAELGAVHYGGTARDTGGYNAFPGGGPMASLRIVQHGARWGMALRISYANPGFTLGKNGVDVTDRTTGTLVEVSPLVTTRVGGVGPSGAVRLEVGPALHLWDFGGEYRKRIGGVAAAAYEWPVTRRLKGAVRLEGLLSSSWFDSADVPPEFERHATWRYGVGLGLRYRLSGA